MPDLSPRDLQEVLDKLVEIIGSRTETAREAFEEEKDLSEAEIFLRQKERKEREDAAKAIKAAREEAAKAAYAAAQADWDKLTDTEQQAERQKELDAEANEIAEKAIQDKKASDAELKQITENQESTFRRRAKYELESLGLVKDSQGKLHQLANEREEIEKKLIEDLQKGLAESPALQQKYGADAKNAKLAMEQERLYKQQLASMGRYVDSNNKIIDTTVKLNKEQEASVKKIKQETESREASIQAVEQFNNMLGMKGAMAAGGFALTTAFDFLKASIVGTYKGLIAYEDALLDGVRGQSVEAAMISEQQNAYADALENTGGSLVSFGGQLIVQAAQMALTSIPMALLAAAIAGVLAVLGYASQAQATIIKRDAELNKKRAALEDEAYKNFLELGEASMTGARGVTGMIDDLARVGLTIKEFDKLNKILSANSKEIAMFGATTVDGAQKFVEVTGNLIKDEMSRVFEKMGISQNAQMEHAQKFMAQQARFGIKIQGDQTKAVINYITELDRVAALTGASRKEQEDARKAVMADRQTRAALFEAQQKVKENPNDQEAILRVKVLQDTMRIAANLRTTYGTEIATGYQQNIAAKGITSQASSMAEMMIPELIAATKAGTVNGSGLAEAAVGIERQLSQYAGTIMLVPDMLLKIVPEFDKAADGLTIMTALMEAKAKSEANGKPFDENKFIDEYRKPATDPKTELDLATARKTQEEALAKQTGLLNGQLGAAAKMQEAAGMFGTAGNTMMVAAEKMLKSAAGFFEKMFGNKKEQVEKEITDANVKREEALLAQKKATTDLEKVSADRAVKYWNEKLKDLDEERKKQLVLENRKAKIQEAQEKLNAAEAKYAKTMETATMAQVLGFGRDADQIKAMEELTRVRAAMMQLQNANLTDMTGRHGPLPGTSTPAAAPAAPAPQMAEGGVVPGSAKGTTITVGEKGVPEAIVPLAQFKGMLGGSSNKDSDAIITRLSVTNDNLNQTNKDSDATITRLNVINNNLNQTNNKLLESNNKLIEASSKQFKLTEDNNKLLGTDGPLIKSTNALKDTDDKLIVSMKNVTDMLPNVLAQIVAATANSGAGGSTGAGGSGSIPSGATPIPQAATSGGTVKASADTLKQAGLIIKSGDVQKDDGDIDPKLIEIAKQVQASIPGFVKFSGFNDDFHKQGQHAKGKAFDFTLNDHPSKEKGAEIVAKLKSLGLDYGRDEYNNPSENATGGHFHGQLNAFDGGVFEPRPGGVHVNLAEAGLREAAVPLNPGEKIRVEKSEQENNPPRKDPLSTVMATDAPSNSNQAAEILASLHDLMEDKFDSMISALRDGNNISDKILKYSQA